MRHDFSFDHTERELQKDRTRKEDGHSVETRARSRIRLPGLTGVRGSRDGYAVQATVSPAGLRAAVTLAVAPAD